MKAVEKRKEKRGGERERGPTGQREKCGGSMSASDKGISLPPVGQKERLTMQVLPPPRARAWTRTPLSVDVSSAAWD